MQYVGGKGKFYAGDGANNYFYYDGTNISISSSNFVLNTEGNIVANNAHLQGYISSSEGYIGG